MILAFMDSNIKGAALLHRQNGISTFMENSIRQENTLNISKINSLATGTTAANRST